jgi:hypothetical protein
VEGLAEGVAGGLTGEVGEVLGFSGASRVGLPGPEGAILPPPKVPLSPIPRPPPPPSHPLRRNSQLKAEAGLVMDGMLTTRVESKVIKPPREVRLSVIAERDFLYMVDAFLLNFLLRLASEYHLQSNSTDSAEMVNRNVERMLLIQTVSHFSI